VGFFRALNPRLAVDGDVVATPESSPVSLGDRLDRLCREGYCDLPRIVDVAAAEQMAAAIDNLGARGVPPVFAYVYDAFWDPLASLAAPVAAVLGAFDVLDDVWAWRISAGTSGWGPHRGQSIAERSPTGRPVMLNVWIALTDVSTADACIHVVPLNEDPSYPDHLDRVDVPFGAARVLPAAAGTALLWNANVLHWGGECRSPSRGRVSFSYTLRARAAARLAGTPVNLATFSFRSRLDLVARQIVTYSGHEPSFPSAAREWAHATVGMLELGRHRPRMSA
jgi:hypothetical protein